LANFKLKAVKFTEELLHPLVVVIEFIAYSPALRVSKYIYYWYWYSSIAEYNLH
jgi:hypothetical protein